MRGLRSLGILAMLLLFALATMQYIACSGDDDDTTIIINPDDDDDTADDDDDDDDIFGDDDTGDDDAGDDDTGDDDTEAFWTEDFDAMAAGPLGDPWQVDGTNATAEVVAVKAGSGNVLEITDDSTVEGDGVRALIDLRSYTELGSAFTVGFDVLGSSGNSIGFAVMQFDTNYQAFFPEFIVRVTETGYVALHGPAGEGGEVECAAIDPTAWHTLTVGVDTTAHTFTVAVDGTPGSCDALPFFYGDFPLAGVAVYGFGDPDYSGVGQFDHFAAFATAPAQ